MPFLSLHSLTEHEIEVSVKSKRPGVYILDRSIDPPFKFHYVGRSDNDLPGNLRTWVESGYRYFKFDYAFDAQDAFETQCRVYHENHPPDNDGHPQKPHGASYECPVAECGTIEKRVA
jgi:hypothetical protein